MHILVKRSKPEATDVDVLVAPVWEKTALALPDPVAQLDATSEVWSETISTAVTSLGR